MAPETLDARPWNRQQAGYGGGQMTSSSPPPVTTRGEERRGTSSKQAMAVARSAHRTILVRRRTAWIWSSRQAPRCTYSMELLLHPAPTHTPQPR